MKTKTINWQKLALNLRRHTNLTRAAERAGIDPATLRRISRGETEEPKFTQGIKLLDLHSDICPEQHKELRWEI